MTLIYVRKVFIIATTKKRAAYAARFSYSNPLLVGTFHEGGICKLPLDMGEELGEIVAGGDALVHDHAQGDAPVEHDAGAGAAGHLAHVAHGDAHAGGSEVVNVVVDVVGADAGQIGDEKAGVEGAGVDDGLGQQVVPVGPADEIYARPDQAAHLQQGVHKGVQLVGVVVLAVLGDILVDLALHVEDVVVHVEVYLAHGVVVLAGAQHHHAHAELVALINALVDDKAVYGGEVLHRPQIGAHDKGQVAYMHAILPLVVHV